ncbi:hypothetical protein HOO54_21065 [Bacillus sp. WMMC1349]|uniref:hypothetical protein n=1 Tax=Bacillus sp. WMMC1349 TaxID=2736254 RepID=UPI0015533072|nr:hypothetical protein [Bacillus sp. WMMC1349]NPC94649.1 hypothetical protein [Bacillus sp. WMMC1349]
MIKKNLFLVILLCIGFVWLVISSYEKDPYEEVIYKKGLPKEDSPAFKEFLRNHLGSSTDITLRYQDHTYTMARDDIDDGLQFYKYTDKQLYNRYKSVFSMRKNIEDKFNDLKNNVDFYKEGTIIQDKVGENLPDMKIEKKSLLSVKTKRGEKKIKIPLSTDSKEASFNLLAVNKTDIMIEVNGEASESYYLFLKQDFSKHQFVKKEEFYAAIQSGILNHYLSLFPKVTENGSYLKLFDNYILEKKTNKVREIKNTDYLSVDGKYVYINERKEKERDVMSDGVQKIQTVDNYLKGNHKYEAQFKIDFENIAEEMDIKASDVRHAEIHYFNDDYVVLSVSYFGIMGVIAAGDVNVLIDLQKSKKQPTAYLVNLGID